eukprot:403358805
MSSNPPGYTPVYNPQGYQSNQPAVYGQPIGYVPQSEFEPGYHEYQRKLAEMHSQGALASNGGNQYQSTMYSTNPHQTTNPSPSKKSYPVPQRRYMSGVSYNDSRYSQSNGHHDNVQTVRTNDPIKIYCQNCDDEVHTNVISYPGPYAWGACVVCCLMGCFLFCCVPLCLDPLNKSRHYCDRCNKLLAQND